LGNWRLISRPSLILRIFIGIFKTIVRIKNMWNGGMSLVLRQPGPPWSHRRCDGRILRLRWPSSPCCRWITKGFEDVGSMRCPLHLWTRFYPPLSSYVCCHQVLHTMSHSKASKSCMHDVSCRSTKSCMLLPGRRWCDSDRKWRCMECPDFKWFPSCELS
jgi:hypothetical protein